MLEKDKVILDLSYFNYLLECEKEVKKIKNEYHTKEEDLNSLSLDDAIKSCYESMPD